MKNQQRPGHKQFRPAVPVQYCKQVYIAGQSTFSHFNFDGLMSGTEKGLTIPQLLYRGAVARKSRLPCLQLGCSSHGRKTDELQNERLFGISASLAAEETGSGSSSSSSGGINAAAAAVLGDKQPGEDQFCITDFLVTECGYCVNRCRQWA